MHKFSRNIVINFQKSTDEEISNACIELKEIRRQGSNICNVRNQNVMGLDSINIEEKTMV